jgi:hypothetical protein
MVLQLQEADRECGVSMEIAGNNLKACCHAQHSNNQTTIN